MRWLTHFRQRPRVLKPSFSAFFTVVQKQLEFASETPAGWRAEGRTRSEAEAEGARE
jgi:hypothetical protein